ncbi:MAG: N-6 DNA methylase [Flavobacteriales bacterium]|jgi:hypothetical protein|nr:N-6 DNA methylase [Flavobacteriales bacterium]
MNHPSVDLQGNVISAEVLDQLVRAEIQGQKPGDFGLPTDTTVDRAIGEAWTTARTKWKQFQEKRTRITSNGFADTRKYWVKPLLQELGYELEGAEPELLDGSEKPFPISLRAEGLEGFPVHVVGVGQPLDERHANGGRNQTPHALLQEYLNHSEHVYGLVTNGLQLRLLRDSTRLGRLAYVEFDLERILEQEIYPDFQVLYRLLHASRLPRKPEATEEALIERYHQQGIESGSRIREKLRLEVKKAMETLANGLLAHNPAFAEAAQAGQVQPTAYYQVLLRTVYRMLFLIVIEERDLVHPEPTGEGDEMGPKRDYYRRYYSFGRLRKLALHAAYVDGRRTDLWQSLLSTFRLFEKDGYGEALGIAPLGGDLFGKALEVNGHDLHSLKLDNRSLLAILTGLTLTRSEQGALVAVNYNDLDVEELGSIYEGLLELHPVLDTSTGTPLFSFTAGSERKLTGSYYTRHDLVAQLIRTALLPVMEDRLKGKRSKEEQEAALLGITVLDPACGSGHFLLAAARKLSESLAQIRTGSENPGKRDLIAARRDVIGRCIHGVDKNPAAIELCRLALWLEAHTTGKPLTFLEHRIRPGDALVGVDKLERLREGIPDGAFEPVTGDHSKTASAFKKRNKQFRTTKQYGLFGEQLKLDADMDRFAAGYQAVEALRNDDLKDRAEKEARYAKYKSDRGWWKDKVACDLFTYAFFQRYPEGLKESEVVDTELLLRQLNSAGSLNAALEAKALELSERERFFHWPLEFPDVWKRGGFDVVLANPPWERIKLQEKEFFETRDEAISNAPNAAARKRLIAQLPATKPDLWAEYDYALHAAECTSKFILEGVRYPLTGHGDVNTYPVFAELILRNLSPIGRGGFIVPTGIATDDGNKEFFGFLVEKDRLVSLFDFQNATGNGRFFPSVHPQYKFTLLTVAGADLSAPASFGFFLRDVLDLNDTRRVFNLTRTDFLSINPNTKTCPVFRTRYDADLTASIYSRVPVLVNERLGQNPLGISFLRMFDMSNDSGLFRKAGELSTKGFEAQGGRYVKEHEVWSPLLEGKLIWLYDHQYTAEERGALTVGECSEYISSMEVPGTERYLFLTRAVAHMENERRGICSVAPKSAVGNSALVVQSPHWRNSVLFELSVNSLIYDYVLRIKSQNPNLNQFILRQQPIVSIAAHYLDALLPSVLELQYTTWDIKAFADDLWREAEGELRQALRTQWEENRRATGGHGWVQPDWKEAYPEIDWAFSKGDEEGAQGGIPFPPFKWDEERRAHLRAELDAYYALLYGLERDELRYILDPKEVHGEDFPGETFRVLKDKEIRQYGEYRTRRLVLEAYDRLRPTWDMPAHLERLRVEYERLQQPAEQAPPKVVAEPPADYRTGLFAKPDEDGDELEAPKRGPGRPPKSAANDGQAPEAILAYLKSNAGMHGKSAILEGTGIDAAAWNAAIKQLVEEGKVRKEGEKKGARYGGR